MELTVEMKSKIVMTRIILISLFLLGVVPSALSQKSGDNFILRAYTELLDSIGISIPQGSIDSIVYEKLDDHHKLNLGSGYLKEGVFSDVSLNRFLVTQYYNVGFIKGVKLTSILSFGDNNNVIKEVFFRTNDYLFARGLSKQSFSFSRVEFYNLLLDNKEISIKQYDSTLRIGVYNDSLINARSIGFTISYCSLFGNSIFASVKEFDDLGNLLNYKKYLSVIVFDGSQVFLKKPNGELNSDVIRTRRIVLDINHFKVVSDGVLSPRLNAY